MVQRIPVIRDGARALRRLYDWMATLVGTPLGLAMLGLFFFVEATILFPSGPLLILFCSEKPKSSYFYALVAAFCSTLGAALAYYIGLSVWELAGQKLVALCTTQQKFDALCQYYQTHQAAAVLIAGLTPIPFQAITLSAGFCRIAFVPFIICTFIIRAVRMLLIAAVMFRWGTTIRAHIDRYFNSLVLVFLLLVVSMLCIIT